MPTRHLLPRQPRMKGRAYAAGAALVIACAFASGAVSAAPPAKTPPPEIVRPPATPQAVGIAHTLRTIPEACARLEGRFTGEAAEPYTFAAVRSRPNCQPRARFVDAAQAKPSTASGWVLNDEIRVPNAACPSQQAVVRVWRKPVDVAPPKLDAQGRARLYLQEAQQAAQADRIAPVPQFAAQMAVEGGCS
jgi:hypothetical protein